MAIFKHKQLREGYDGVKASYGSDDTTAYEPKIHTVLVEVECDECDEVLIIPDGITHVGYEEKKEDSHVKWADWHHPSKGADLIPDRYYLSETEIKIPSNIRKIVIPPSVRNISSRAFAEASGVTLEVHPENPYLEVRDNQILTKS